MNNTEILNIKKQISEKLTKRQLKGVFGLLMKIVVNTQDWMMPEKVSELETNYKYMLHYQFEGLADSQREKIYNNIIRTLYEITDDSTDELLSISSSNVFFERLRIQKNKSGSDIKESIGKLKSLSASLSVIDLINSENTDQQEINLEVKRERLGSDLFNSVFTSSRTNTEECKFYINYIYDQDIYSREKSLFISALTMSLFRRFDIEKFKVIIESTKSTIKEVRIRAIVGLVIILQMYEKRLEYYPECKNLLDDLAENDNFRKSVLVIIKQLIRSRNTEEISRKLTEEILPEMMKLNSLAGKKLNMEELMSDDLDFTDKNPDWKKELENSGIANKLQEYSSLQMEGADVFHSTFANLKNFSFFGEMSNWFLPFDINYSELHTIFPRKKEGNSILHTAVLNSGHMCNSDKYSFALSLLQIPASQREMMTQRFGDESAQLKELQKDAEALNPTINDDVLSNQYIQDLYRFFKLYPFRNNFEDIFKLKLNFYDNSYITPFIQGDDNMLTIANFCFDKNFIDEALTIYQKLASKHLDNSDIWQKIGFCKQTKNDLQGALDAYLQAEINSPNNTWITKRIAQTYKSLKQPQKALEYYTRASHMTPNNINLELNIGHCYLELGEYEDALNCYFKVEILETKSKAWRPIAWTAFLLNKFDVAEKYYKQIISNSPNAHDYLNAGHVQLCQNNQKKAIQYYLNAINKLSDISEFEKLFLDDVTVLKSFNIDDNIYPMLFDELKYKLD